MKFKTELLLLQSTTFCNINCKYCYLPDRNKASKFDLTLLEVALQNLKESGLLGEKLNLLWHFGEPLSLNLSFYEAAAVVLDQFKKESGIAIVQSIQTNATLIKQETCDLINKHKINIGVSIDGPKFIHDENRITRKGAGTYNHVLKGIDLLKQNGIEFSVIAVLTKTSLSFPREIFDFFSSLEVESLGFNIDESGASNISSSIIDEENVRVNFKNFFDTFWILNKEAKRKIKLREFDEIITNISVSGGNSFCNTLSEPFKIITVDTNGSWSTFCPELMASSDQRFIYGNVRHGLIIDAFSTKKMQDDFFEIANGIRNCKISCDYFIICGGGNPSNKVYENGSFNSTETVYCKFMKKYLTDVVLDKLENSHDLQMYMAV